MCHCSAVQIDPAGLGPIPVVFLSFGVLCVDMLSSALLFGSFLWDSYRLCRHNGPACCAFTATPLFAILLQGKSWQVWPKPTFTLLVNVLRKVFCVFFLRVFLVSFPVLRFTVVFMIALLRDGTCKRICACG